MEFIKPEAEESSENGDTIHFPHVEETIDDNNFINESEEINDNVTFYRNLNPHNADHYNRFPNQLVILFLLSTMTMECISLKKILNLNCTLLKA